MMENPLAIGALVFAALATEHAWRQHQRHRRYGQRRDPDCQICGDEAHKRLGVPITDIPDLAAFPVERADRISQKDLL